MMMLLNLPQGLLLRFISPSEYSLFIVLRSIRDLFVGKESNFLVVCFLRLKAILEEIAGGL